LRQTFLNIYRRQITTVILPCVRLEYRDEYWIGLKEKKPRNDPKKDGLSWYCITK
jgi:hypothetical protein